MTFPVIARDPVHKLLGIAQSTNPLSVGGRCPFIRANVGAVSSQATTDPGLGPLAIELLSLGHSPDKVLADLAASDPDFSWRQVGIVDRHGRAAVHTGTDNKDTKGCHIGEDYVVMGNFLAGQNVLDDMNAAWLGSAGDLFEDRLLKVVVAGRDAGGDMGGHRSACLLVYETEAYARTDLRVDFVPKDSGSDAVDALAILTEKWRPMIEYYKIRPHNPTMPGWRDWLAEQGTPFVG